MFEMSSTAKNAGASPEEWAHFIGLGIQEYLLPVVSRLDATVSAKSALKAVGKVPSVYNNNREVAGIKSWSTSVASNADIARWSTEPDYGICIQCRCVRALDIDVGGADLARAITDFISDFLFMDLPSRSRENSGKCLLAFTLIGNFTKRVMKVNGGMVEFLAEGQQFIAAGTHTSGTRYEWKDGLPEFIELEPTVFEDLWVALAAAFATETPTMLSDRQRRPKAPAGAVHVVDDVLDSLDVISWGSEGEARIVCPFDSEHSTSFEESSESATVYFPKGTRGYEQGHFKCLHAHCADRKDEDFLDALELRIKDFDVVVLTEQEQNEDRALVARKVPELPEGLNLKTNTLGEALATASNLEIVLSRPRLCGFEIRFDEFRDEIMFAPKGGNQWRAFTDTDYTMLRIMLERTGFAPVGAELIHSVVHHVAKANAFDSAVEWLNAIEWDGVPRVRTFLSTYLGTEANEYTDAVSLYMWSGLAGRVLQPGCVTKMVPVFIGTQNLGKSTVVGAFAPAQEFYTEISFSDNETDNARKMRGCLVAEISELKGLHTRELETIKAFVSRTHEKWVPKFREFTTTFPRRLLFFGTTNRKEFLADETGNSRWLPLTCGENGAIRIADVRRDRLQLWAEGREMFKADLASGGDGVLWQAAYRLASGIHDDHKLVDDWQELIETFLYSNQSLGEDAPANVVGGVNGQDIMRFALGMDTLATKKSDSDRLSRIMREIGFERKQLRVDGVVTRRWFKEKKV